MNKDLTRYKLTDPTDIENLILKFLRTVLTAEFIPSHRYSPDKDSSTLTVDIADNIANNVENACPAVILELGDTVYQEVLIDHAAQYKAIPDAGQTKDAFTGKVDPKWNHPAKRTFLEGGTPVTIEVRTYNRISCSKLSARLVKVFFAFAKALSDGTNTRVANTIRCSKPQKFTTLSKTAYKSVISFSTEHMSAENIPEVKDMILQFFLTVKTVGGTVPIEMSEVIK